MTRHSPRLHHRLRNRLRPCWRAYLRVPRLLRWPLTGAALLFLAVIVVNLTGGEPSEVERSFQIPPGGIRTIEAPVAAGRNSEVRWEIGGRDGDAAGFPLRATLRGPDGELASALGPGGFRFKGGFAAARYSLELRNESEGESAAVEVRWTLE